MLTLFLFLSFLFPTAFAQPSAKQRVIPFEDLYIPPQPQGYTNWQHYDGVYASVFYTPQDRATALHLSQLASKALPEIAKVLGVSTGGHVEIYIAPTQDSFLAMQPAIPPDWADGTAWPKSGLIFLRSPTIRSGLSSPLEQVLNHEIAHILLGRAFGHRPVPHWLQEGVAQIVSGEYNGQTMETLGWGKIGSGWYSLQEISRGFPSNAARAKLAYAESAHFVGFLLETYGVHTLQNIIDYMSHGYSFSAAIQNTTGKSVDQLDMEWREDPQLSLLWLKPLTSDTTILAVFAILFMGAVVRTTLKKRVDMQQWEEDEQIQEALAKMLQNWDPTPRQAWVVE